MKYRLAHWLSHGLKLPLTTSLSPPLLQRKEEQSAALNHPLSLRERARVRGCEYETLAILYRENRWQSAQIKEREASASLSCFLPLSAAFNRFRHWPAS